MLSSHISACEQMSLMRRNLATLPFDRREDVMEYQEDDAVSLPPPRQTQHYSPSTHVRGRRKPIRKEDQGWARIRGEHRTTLDDFPLEGGNNRRTYTRAAGPVPGRFHFDQHLIPDHQTTRFSASLAQEPSPWPSSHLAAAADPQDVESLAGGAPATRVQTPHSPRLRERARKTYSPPRHQGASSKKYAGASHRPPSLSP